MQASATGTVHWPLCPSSAGEILWFIMSFLSYMPQDVCPVSQICPATSPLMFSHSYSHLEEKGTSELAHLNRMHDLLPEPHLFSESKSPLRNKTISRTVCLDLFRHLVFLTPCTHRCSPSSDLVGSSTTFLLCGYHSQCPCVYHQHLSPVLPQTSSM